MSNSKGKASPPSPISNHDSSNFLSVVAFDKEEEEEEEPIPCVISPEIMSKEITREKWVCDFCKNATFDDFQDACDHETLCKSQQQAISDKATQNEPLCTTEKNAKENFCPPTVINENIDTDRKKKDVSETTPIKPKQLKFLPTEKSKKCCQFESCQVCEDNDTQSNTTIHPTTKKSSPEVQIVSTTKAKTVTASIFLKQAKLVPTKAKTNKSTTSNATTNGKRASCTSAKQQNIAAIFQNPSQKSAILAEHRAAEFAAKRRLQQEAEKERERKRQETRKALYEEKQKKLIGAKLSVFQVTSAKATPKRLASGSNQSLIDLTVDTPQIKKTCVVKNIKAKDLRAYPPRYPVPSHVIQSDQSEEHTKDSYISEDQYKQFIRTSHYPLGKDSVASEPNDIPPCHLPLNVIPTHYHSDVLHQSFSRVLKSESSDAYMKDDTSKILWSEKYTMKALPHDIYGEENKQTAQNLIDFIQEWKGHRQRMYQARAEAREKAKRKGKKRPKKVQYYSDDDIWSDDEGDGALCNLFLLTGEVGSGKTSLVHAAAKNCQCPLIEINSTLERGGKALKRAIEESTQSESSLALLKHSNSLDAFGVLDEGDNDEEGIPNSSLAIILIDEVDLLFETDGDSGFWQGLGAVAKKAKCPIILTSASVPRQLSNFRFKLGHLERPKAFECASKMCQIARMEGIKWQQGVDQDTIKNELAAIARVCGCDLRRIMNEMQLYRFGKPCDIFNDISSTFADDENKNELYFPRIKDISPRTVSSCSHSVVAITGANFTSLCFTEASSVTPIVNFGDQVSPIARVVNDNLILAICPPCDIPENLDSFGCYENTYDSLCTRFKRVTVELRYANGLVFRSDASVSILKMGEHCPSTFIEYSFEDIDEAGTKGKVALTLEEMKVLLDNHPIRRDVYENNPKTISSITSSQSDFDVMMKLSNTFAMESDSIFIKDGLEVFGMKHLTGIMHDDQDLLNDEAGLACGWVENGNRMGAPETYMTRATARRDIILIANCFAHARGSADYNADAIIPSPSEEEINPATDVWTHLENNEDIFISNDNCFEMYNGVFLNQSMHKLRLDLEARYRKDYLMNEVGKLSQYIIADERQSDMTDDSYWLDYVPTLRHMAATEEIQQKRYNLMMANTDLDFKQGARRSGRRSRRNDDRYHYFESVLDSAAYRSNTDEAREISMELSKLELKYHNNNECETKF